MLDIYKYINSKDTREYLRNINYKFNVKEALFIINHSFDITIEEKHKLLKEVMNEYDDIAYKEHKSLYDIININRKRREEALDFFINDKDTYVYTFTIYFSDIEEYESDIFFSSLDEVKKYLEKNKKELFYESWRDINKTVEFDFVEVKKYKIDSDKYIGSIALNEALDIVYINISSDIIKYSVGYELKELDAEDITSSFFLNIPTPFKKGDILIHPKKKPFLI